MEPDGTVMAQRPASQQAFTLIELLIVIGLIAVLVVALAPNILGPSEQARRAETKARMDHLKLCIETFARKRGYYPPSSFALADKGIKVKNNTTNEGIECLLVHIHHKSLGRSATLEDKADWLENTDNDDGGFYIELLGTTKLFEVMDAWRYPIVYFREDAYDQRQTVLTGGEDQEQETVRAWRNPLTNKYLNPRKYQLISAGPDGVFGTEDDVTYPERPIDK
ncbi:MAG: type II secretion system protein [Planctomycetota bacterium]|jgi:prepilin-type N-terminal cleavage/methylation domain-containing protein